MKEETKANLKNTNTWLRLVFMILFVIFYSFAGSLFMLIVAFQFLVSLFTGSPNQRLIPFSKEITQYIYAVLLYLSYNSDEKPFPFSDWPSIDKSNSSGTGKK